MAKVAIVGAGFGGLATAWELGRILPHAEILVLEASPRIAGRVETAFFDAHNAYNASAAELYDIEGSPGLKKLVEGLGLKRRPMQGTPYFAWQGDLLASKNDFRDALGSETVHRLDRFWERGISLRPIENYAEAGGPEDNEHPWIRTSFADVLARELSDEVGIAFTVMQVHSDLATDPALTNGVFGFDNLLIDDPDYCSFYLIEGGNELLPVTLAETANASIVTNAPVRKVSPNGRGFTVQYGKSNRIDVDAVVISMQPHAFDRIDWDRPIDKVASKHASHHRYWTEYLRVTFLCTMPYWQEILPEDYFVADCFGGVTVYDQSWMGDGRSGIFSLLLAGEPAMHLSSMSDRAIAGIVADELPPLLAEQKHMIVDARVNRFQGASGVSRLPGGLPLQPYEARHTAYPGLFFTGDYLYDATLNGAYDSALWVSSAIAQMYGVAVENPVRRHRRTSRRVPKKRSLPFLRSQR